LNQLVLSYWLTSEGSLQTDNKTMIIHTQSFNYETNFTLSTEFNNKVDFNYEVIIHTNKNNYFVIKILTENSNI
jgi:hypothetical protein